MSDDAARLVLVGVVAAGALLALSLVTGVIETPDVGGILADAADSLGAWAYLAIPALAFLETGALVGLFVPGETAIVVGGVVAERGEVGLPLLIALVWAAAVGGDVVSFLLGRCFGRPFLDAHGPRLRIRPAEVDRVERFLPYTALGALGWVTTFSLVDYGFSETFQSARRNATRITLAGALVIGAVLLALAPTRRVAIGGRERGPLE